MAVAVEPEQKFDLTLAQLGKPGRVEVKPVRQQKVPFAKPGGDCFRLGELADIPASKDEVGDPSGVDQLKRDEGGLRQRFPAARCRWPAECGIQVLVRGKVQAGAVDGPKPIALVQGQPPVVAKVLLCSDGMEEFKRSDADVLPALAERRRGHGFAADVDPQAFHGLDQDRPKIVDDRREWLGAVT